MRARIGEERELLLMPMPSQLDRKLKAAWAASDAGDPTLAARIYGECLSIDPRHAETLRELGLITYGVLKDAVEARRLVEKSLEIEDSPTAHFYLALILDRLKEIDLAMPHFEIAIERSGGDAMMHSMYADVLAGHGQFEKALHHFKAALSKKQDYLPAQQGCEKVIQILADERGQ